ncbi:MAG: YihY family inner membrane protein [Neisseria sp.]|uniref:YihY family inner membrane protein n=1 Tax=Neisseria sp. TaxID=192066 RepID=UPI0026DB954D|nr:YihY family inner membrane protein [Neisseria sp.]MDO4248800.1 YihY family inner membrane protein [Neisseria sp.]
MLKSSRLQEWRRSRWFGFTLFLWQRFNGLRVPQTAGSLTFTSLLALVPVLTVALVVISAFPMFSEVSGEFVRFINMTIVPQGADAVMDYLNEFKAKASNLTAIGIIMLGVTSLLLVQTIDQTFNRIWQVKNPRPLWMQFLLYWALLTFGPLAVGVSLLVWGLLLKQSGLETAFPLLSETLAAVTSLLFSTVALWLLYRLVPNRFVPAKHAFAGALITAVLLEILRWGFKLYISRFNSYQLIYGAFAAIPVFLVWLHALWMVVISGAVLTSTFSYWRGEAFRRRLDAHGRFDDVLKILLLLDEAQQSGRVMKVQQFRQHINMGYDELGDLLEQLVRYGYTFQGRHGWVLKTNAEHIIISDLFKYFVYRSTGPASETDYLAKTIDQIMQPCIENLHISLADFKGRMQAHRDGPPEDASRKPEE